MNKMLLLNHKMSQVTSSDNSVQKVSLLVIDPLLVRKSNFTEQRSQETTFNVGTGPGMPGCSYATA